VKGSDISTVLFLKNFFIVKWARKRDAPELSFGAMSFKVERSPLAGNLVAVIVVAASLVPAAILSVVSPSLLGLWNIHERRIAFPRSLIICHEYSSQHFLILLMLGSYHT